VPEAVIPIKLSGGAKLYCRDCIDMDGNDCPIIEEE
jgi:hypothetical protein